MEVTVYGSIAEVNEKEWDAIVGRDRIICTHRYLEAIEKSNINDCRYYYPVVYDGGKIIAHTCVYSISTELDVFAKGIVKRLINTIRKRWKNFLVLKTLECGTPVCLGNTISFSRGIDKESALKLIIKAMETVARKQKLNIILMRDFYEHELFFNRHFSVYGFEKVNNLPNAMLEVRWKGFDEYLQNMRSHYRHKIKKRMFIAQNSGLKVSLCTDFSRYSVELENLWENVYNHASEYRREILTKEFFLNMDTYLENRSKVILVKIDEKLVGFALLLSAEDTLTFMFSGLDYEYNEKHCVYFCLLYDIIKTAIKEQKERIDLGITTLIPKIDLGAEAKILNVYMKHLNPILSFPTTFAFKLMASKNKFKPRQVFKGN